MEKQKKASIPKSKSMLKASTIFGLTNEVLNEVVKSLKANVINMSDIDEIISNTGHKEISNEEFKIKVQEQLNNSNLSSVEQVDISKKQVVQTIFSNSDTISNKKIQCKSKAHLKALAIFGLTEKLVDEIINSLKNYIISINDVDEILSQCEFKFISPEQAMKKINTSLEKQIPIKTVFKNYDDQQIEENASKKM